MAAGLVWRERGRGPCQNKLFFNECSQNKRGFYTKRRILITLQTIWTPTHVFMSVDVSVGGGVCLLGGGICGTSFTRFTSAFTCAAYASSALGAPSASPSSRPSRQRSCFLSRWAA